ncbi:MAG: hypothetical protein GY738_20395 [Pseudoalteromonas sp.]|nr:hypothetical protein [Pseudoalteromonas sp.]
MREIEMMREISYLRRKLIYHLFDDEVFSPSSLLKMAMVSIDAWQEELIMMAGPSYPDPEILMEITTLRNEIREGEIALEEIESTTIESCCLDNQDKYLDNPGDDGAVLGSIETGLAVPAALYHVHKSEQIIIDPGHHGAVLGSIEPGLAVPAAPCHVHTAEQIVTDLGHHGAVLLSTEPGRAVPAALYHVHTDEQVVTDGLDHGHVVTHCTGPDHIDVDVGHGSHSDLGYGYINPYIALDVEHVIQHGRRAPSNHGHDINVSEKYFAQYIVLLVSMLLSLFIVFMVSYGLHLMFKSQAVSLDGGDIVCATRKAADMFRGVALVCSELSFTFDGGGTMFICLATLLSCVNTATAAVAKSAANLCCIQYQNHAY